MGDKIKLPSFAVIIPYPIVNIILQYISEITRERWVGNISKYGKFQIKISKHWKDLPDITNNCKILVLEAEVFSKFVKYFNNNSVYILSSSRENNNQDDYTIIEQKKKNILCIRFIKKRIINNNNNNNNVS